MSKELGVRILELRKLGKSVNEICKEIRCSKSNISYHINKNGLGGVISKNKSGLFSKVSEEMTDTIKNMRLQGKTYEEIFELVDISPDLLKKICRKLKLNKPNNKKALPSNSDEIITFYEKVRSIRITAKEFCISREMVKACVGDKIVSNRNTNSLETQMKIKSQYTVSWRIRKREYFIKLKGGCCSVCGYKKSISALHFHHIDPLQKDFNVGGSNYSFERLTLEVEKCILVCANCHIEIHEQIRKTGFSEMVDEVLKNSVV